MGQGLCAFCVSTIVKKEKLENFAVAGSGKITEETIWKTGAALLREAQTTGVEMPVIFSDAAHDTETLLYWATLRRIDIDDDSAATTVKFAGVKRIRGEHKRSDLTLKSTGKRIKKRYIKPYAICETPEWLK
jgi:hypothetical protein